MGIVIALSGVGNTGKTTLIDKIENTFGKESIFILRETAREVIETIGIDDMGEFQNNVYELELARSNIIKNAREIYDLIVVDRTWIDQLAYLTFNMINGKIQTPINQVDLGDIYDYIFYFDTPIKKTNTKAFEHYNDDVLLNLMSTIVKGRFGNKVDLYQNGMIDGDNIIKKIYSFLPKKGL